MRRSNVRFLPAETQLTLQSAILHLAVYLHLFLVYFNEVFAGFPGHMPAPLRLLYRKASAPPAPTANEPVDTSQYGARDKQGHQGLKPKVNQVRAERNGKEQDKRAQDASSSFWFEVFHPAEPFDGR